MTRRTSSPALGVVEIGRHGDHGLVDLLAKIVGRVIDQLTEYLGRDLFRGNLFAQDGETNRVVAARFHPIGYNLDLRSYLPVFSADKTLGRENSAFGIEHGLTLGQLSDQTLSLFGVGDRRGSGSSAFAVVNNHRLPAFHNGDHRVGGSQIYSYCFYHDVLPPVSREFSLLTIVLQ